MKSNNKILLFDDPEEFLIFMDYLEQQYKNKKCVNETVKNNNNSGVGRVCH